MIPEFVKKILILLLILLLTLNTAMATFISISTNIGDIVIENRSGTALIGVTNLGDESAHEVQISFLLPDGFTADDIFIGRFDPNKPFETDFNIRSENVKPPGLYPGALIVDYKDANLYPFSALTPFNIVNKERTSTSLIGVIDEVSLKGDRSQEISINLRNTDPEVKSVTLRLFLPRELTAKDNQKKISIGPQEEGKAVFEVSSFSALVGSTYQVFVSATYEEDDQAHSTFIRGVVKIEEEESTFFSKNILMILLALLLTVFVVYQFRGR